VTQEQNELTPGFKVRGPKRNTVLFAFLFRSGFSDLVSNSLRAEEATPPLSWRVSRTAPETATGSATANVANFMAIAKESIMHGLRAACADEYKYALYHHRAKLVNNPWNYQR
jgi:hypothetical protein